MPFHQPDAQRYYTFDSLTDCKVTHAIISRHGGVSPEPWAALNVGGTVGDDPERVLENKRRTFQALNRPFDSLYDVWQVHGNEVVCTNLPRPLTTPHLKADAILTDRPEVTLFMRFADCVPIFLADPQRRVVGLVHAGWQGTVKRVAASAIQVMQEKYHSRPETIVAAIGPSIGAHHYQVGPEVVEQVEKTFAQDAASILHIQNENSQNGVQFDLWDANRLVLEQAGVERIEVAGICTVCHMDDWYSHRGEKGHTGRFGALIGL